MKKILSFLLLGAMAFSLAACGDKTVVDNKEQQEQTQVQTPEQPGYFKNFEATGENVAADNKIRELFLISDYENIWKKMTYQVFTFSKDGVNGQVPKEEEDYVLTMTYDELIGANMKDIYVIMPSAYEGVDELRMIAFMSGDENTSILFEDFAKMPRDMTFDIGTLNTINWLFNCNADENFLIYDYVLEQYGQPSEISVQYDSEDGGYVLFAVYKMEDWTVTFAFGEYEETYRHLLIVEPVREDSSSDNNGEKTDTTQKEDNSDAVESPYKDKT